MAQKKLRMLSPDGNKYCTVKQYDRFINIEFGELVGNKKYNVKTIIHDYKNEEDADYSFLEAVEYKFKHNF